MIDRGKKSVLGVNVDTVDYDAAVDRFISAAKRGERYTTTALAVHGVMTGAWDIEHRHRLNHLDMVVPDGMPVRWALNFLYRAELPDRVYGPNLMLYILKQAEQQDLPVFFFGTSEETLKLLVARIQEKFPRLMIVGAEASQFRKISEDEKRQLVERIRNSGAKITFVGLGCPRQEVWAYEMGDALSMPIFAVGAAFPFHAGTLSQAPKWMQDNGLEWLYRFVSEPRRLWKRYVLLNPAYLFLLGLQMLGVRSPDPNKTIPPTTEHRFG